MDDHFGKRMKVMVQCNTSDIDSFIARDMHTINTMSSDATSCMCNYDHSWVVQGHLLHYVGAGAVHTARAASLWRLLHCAYLAESVPLGLAVGTTNESIASLIEVMAVCRELSERPLTFIRRYLYKLTRST